MPRPYRPADIAGLHIIPDGAAILGRLALAAPLGDWRLDPRVAAIPLPAAPPRIVENDLLGNIQTALYGGAEAQALRTIRDEYHRALREYAFADAMPFAPGSPELRVLQHVIAWMPDVEHFIDHGVEADAERMAA